MREGLLRYPGGKSRLAPLLAETIKLNGMEGCRYYEPFAGGSGAALKLLRDNTVSEAHLNDIDPAVAAFWLAVTGQPERFAQAISDVPLTIDEWLRQKATHRVNGWGDTFALGFAFFYLNRCNRSGVIHAAGPIGGRDQNGKWKLDARFSRKNLQDRVFRTAEMSDRICVSQMDAVDFMSRRLPRGTARTSAFVYLDPPYYLNAKRLYSHVYTDEAHRRLCVYLKRQRTLRWLLSYNDEEPVRRMYDSFAPRNTPMRYSLNSRTVRNELLIPSRTLELPPHPESNPVG